MNLKLLKIERFFHLISKKDYNEKRQIEIVKNSPLFDAKWYLSQNPDVKNKNMGAAKHYVKYGWKEGRNPSPNFDNNAYLEEYPELEAKGWCPVFHYMLEHKNEWNKKDNKKEHNFLIQNQSKNKLKFLQNEQNKGVVYTCITGGYDDLIEHTYKYSNWDYVCFCDNEELIKKGEKRGWKIYPLRFNKLDDVRNARWHKTHPHILFPKYKYSIWIDGNIDVCGSLMFEKTNEGIKDKRIIMAPLHPKRKCVYEEAIAVKNSRKDDDEVVDSFVKVIEKEGYPLQNGLHETGILYREHNNHIVKKMMNEWFSIIKRYSKRDQLSFDYLLWKNKIEIVDFFGKETIGNNKNFVLNYLGKHSVTKCKKMLVHLHLYYLEQLEYFFEKLENITLPYDLIVTTNNFTEDLKSKILNFKRGARVIRVDNIGYDIYPFYQILHKVNLDDYNYILKLHTKNYREKVYINNNNKFKGFEWRNCLVDSLLYSKKQFVRNIDTLNLNSKYGMIGPVSLIRNIKKDGDANFVHKLLPMLKEKLGLTPPLASFVCGSMFLAKANLFVKFKSLQLNKEYFNTTSKTSEIYSMAHALERYLGLLVYEQNKQIYGVENIVKSDLICYNYDFNGLNFKSYRDMADDIKCNIEKFSCIDLVVGVPRSGMIPAYMLGQLLNCGVCSISEFINKQYFSNSYRKLKSKNIKNVLILDDSINKGVALRDVRKELNSVDVSQFNIKYGVIYATDDSKQKVDIYCSLLEQPRMFEWNYLNHSFIRNACFDIDGVLCKDPTEEENSNEAKYIHFIKNATPLFIPKYKIKAIVTSRLEKYRKETECWLKENGVEYEKLYMLNLGSKEARKELNAHASFKSMIYNRLDDAVIFYESSRKQAMQIADSTHKPVFCVDTTELFK
ncbi:MAG: DUF616 domain-containing protein [Alphaproteobacteria bacterium]|nr:DUF616 domain-containing protein [Alphaproteobacteria bacterium]